MISRSRLSLAFVFLAAVIVGSAMLFRFCAEGLRVHMLQPVLNAYLVARYYLDFVPQWILWMLPLFFACALLIRQAFRQPRTARSVRSHRPDAAAAGEGELARLVQQRRANVRLDLGRVHVGVPFGVHVEFERLAAPVRDTLGGIVAREVSLDGIGDALIDHLPSAAREQETGYITQRDV